MKKIKFCKQFLIYISLVCFLFVGSCTNQAIENKNSVAPPSNENKQNAFESDLQTLRTANLKYIFVVRRTDDGKFDGEDKKYLRTNLPTTNRVVLSDEEKAFIVGTNYPFPPENLEVLRLRFRVEDYSAAGQAK